MPQVFIPPQMRTATGGVTEVQLSAANLREVIRGLEERFPGISARLLSGEDLSSTLQVSIDGRLTTRRLSTPVEPQSEVHFLPAIGGG